MKIQRGRGRTGKDGVGTGPGPLECLRQRPPQTFHRLRLGGGRGPTGRAHRRARGPPLSSRPLWPSPRPWKSTRSLPRLIRAWTSESRSLIALFEESFLQTEPKPNGLRDKPKLMSSATASCTDEAHLASSNDASPLRKAKPYFGTYTWEPMGTMLRLRRSSEMPSAKDSTGQRWLLMPRSWCAPARDASTMHGKRTSRPKPSKPSPSHGHSPCGGWTWLGLCRRPRGLYPFIGGH